MREHRGKSENGECEMTTTTEPITLDEARTFIMHYTGWEPISEDPEDDEADEAAAQRLVAAGVTGADLDAMGYATDCGFAVQERIDKLLYGEDWESEYNARHGLTPGDAGYLEPSAERAEVRRTWPRRSGRTDGKSCRA